MLISLQPKTFIITLKGHPVSTRLTNECIDSANKHNWNVEIFWGTHGTSITDQAWLDIGVTPMMNKSTMNYKGVWGCFFSHWRLWNKCIELNEPIIILEHDAIIQQPWTPLENNNNLVKLHARYKPKKIKIDQDTGVWTNSAHAYCLTPLHAIQLISFSKKIGGIPVDVLMGDKVIGVTHLGEPEMIARQNKISTTKV